VVQAPVREPLPAAPVIAPAMVDPAQGSAAGDEVTVAFVPDQADVPEIQPAVSDSILAEREEDDGLISDGTPMVVEPEPEIAPGLAAPAASLPVGVDAVGVDAVGVDAGPAPAQTLVEERSPWADLHTEAATTESANASAQDAAPPTAPPPAFAWGEEHGTPTTESKPPGQAPWEHPPEKAVAEPTQPPPQLRPRRKLPASFWLIAVLAPFTLFGPFIGIAAYRFFERPVHPLEALPDTGIYEERHEGKREIAEPLQALPKDSSPLKLGQTARVGGLEVTPLDVTQRKLTYLYRPVVSEHKGNDEVLVLRLKLKNVSEIIFHPHDPLFNRSYRGDVYAYLEIGKSQFYGAVHDHMTERIDGQNFNELLPGAEMETIFVARESDAPGKRAVDALKTIPTDSVLIWRIHLRKGREDVQLKSGGRRRVWATTVIPVQFTPADVKADRPKE
jgi:hypothetical protein